MVKTDALAGLRVELLGGLLVNLEPHREWHARVVQRLRLCAERMDLLRVPLAAVGGWIPDVALAEPDEIRALTYRRCCWR